MKKYPHIFLEMYHNLYYRALTFLEMLGEVEDTLEDLPFRTGSLDFVLFIPTCMQ